MKSSSEKNTIWIAVPYYCSLLMPQRGLSKIYFLAQVDKVARRICYQAMKIWPGQQSLSLGKWLKQQGAEGVLSNDAAPAYTGEFEKEGLWFWQAPAADVDELIDTWLERVGS